MNTYRSDDGRSLFEFEKTDRLDANGSKSFGFHFMIQSHNFSGSIDNVWIYADDLINFVKSVHDLTSGKVKIVNLSAMSEFVLTITLIDSVGHFAAKFKLIDTFNDNLANLTVELTTQSIDDFANSLSLIVAGDG